MAQMKVIKMQIKNREAFLKIIAISCVVILVGDQLIVGPLMSKWRETADQISTLRQKYDNGQSLVDRERALRRAWRIYQRDDLNDVESLAEQNIYKAEEYWKKESGVSSSGTKPQWTNYDDRFATYSLRMAINGSLQECIKFIHLIESDPLPIRIEEMELAARDKSGQEIGLTLHLTGLKLGKSLQK